MSFRLPQNLSPAIGPEAGVDEFNREVLAEKAAAMGRAGKSIERHLAALAACEDPAERDTLLQQAADTVHALIIQRELSGLRDHKRLMEDFAVPREVTLRIGVRPKRPS